MQVDLNEYDLELVDRVSADRIKRGRHLGLVDETHARTPEESAKFELVGAAGECAVAKALGIYWNGDPGKLMADGDVAGLEVRSTSRRSGHLILKQKKDKLDRRFVLVTGEIPHLTIRGWCIGKDVVAPEFERNTTGDFATWWIPQRLLRPFEELSYSRTFMEQRTAS